MPMWPVSSGRHPTSRRAPLPATAPALRRSASARPAPGPPPLPAGKAAVRPPAGCGMYSSTEQLPCASARPSRLRASSSFPTPRCCRKLSRARPAARACKRGPQRPRDALEPAPSARPHACSTTSHPSAHRVPTCLECWVSHRLLVLDLESIQRRDKRLRHIAPAEGTIAAGAVRALVLGLLRRRDGLCDGRHAQRHAATATACRASSHRRCAAAQRHAGGGGAAAAGRRTRREGPLVGVQHRDASGEAGYGEASQRGMRKGSIKKGRVMGCGWQGRPGEWQVRKKRCGRRRDPPPQPPDIIVDYGRRRRVCLDTNVRRFGGQVCDDRSRHALARRACVCGPFLRTGLRP
eukprot:366129-Chlamydomonas_euryale.AAC.7